MERAKIVGLGCNRWVYYQGNLRSNEFGRSNWRDDQLTKGHSMRSGALYSCLLLAGSTAAVGLWGTPPVHEGSKASAVPSKGWNAVAAADYLDSREIWWQSWPRAQKDHGTLCISCHTTVPYAMARAGLRQELRETQMAAPEKIMLDSVEKRVSHWSEMTPFYSDAVHGVGKTAEAHATEAVLNAVILTSYDVRKGHLRPITRTALDAAWALQEESGEKAGGWKWQDFHLGPWEGGESGYQGAALLMLEVGDAPDGYASEPGAREHVERLRGYLRREYAAQPLMNHVYVLWASSKVPGLLTADERKALVGSLESLQQEDGGWRLSSMDKKKRLDDSPEPMESDGMATGLVVLALESSGGRSEAAMRRRGLKWLEEHQGKEGDWYASSLNKKRDPKSDVGRFMSDAATGYAVLALEEKR
jgi:squalene-hopene/tetraprenyl-beta-curcumene cyclase